jgi:hypothetical protein
VNEHVFAAVIANDEAESLLRIEEFDDALAFANDLWRHSATTATAKTTAAAAEAAAAAETAAATAKAATAAAVTTATATAAIAAAAAEAAAFLVSKFAVLLLLVAETVALVAAAAAAVPFAPSIETHEPSELISPPTPQTNALGPNGATGHGA